MKRYLILSLLVTCLAAALVAPRVALASKVIDARTRFAPVHIYLDSGDRPLAAYQFELRAAKGRIWIVGVEGGAHAAFKEAPYYDPAALMHDRIIIAAFTGQDFPTGRTRIATIHLQVTGDTAPEYELELTVAADDKGESISVESHLAKGDKQ